MKLWKCVNCVAPNGTHGVDFFADKPVCPTCKTDGTDKRFGRMIVACRITHFDPPHPTVNNAGLGVLACDPTKRLGGAMATGDPGVVTCPLCRQSEAWKKAAAVADSTDSVEGVESGLASEVLAKV